MCVFEEVNFICFHVCLHREFNVFNFFTLYLHILHYFDISIRQTHPKYIAFIWYTLPETNKLHLKMVEDDRFPLGAQLPPGKCELWKFRERNTNSTHTLDGSLMSGSSWMCFTVCSAPPYNRDTNWWCWRERWFRNPKNNLGMYPKPLTKKREKHMG